MTHAFSVTFVLLFSLILAGCASRPTNPTGTTTPPSHYKVQAGDTVSKIAKMYKVDWRELSKLNNLDEKHTIYAGQWLILPNHAEVESTEETVASETKDEPKKADNKPSKQDKPTQESKPSPNTTQESRLLAQDIGRFSYPVGRGNTVAKGFGMPIQNGLTEGIFFLGNQGDAIYASEAGTIIYANPKKTDQRPMVMIEHTEGYVSTYFDISEVTVKNAQHVKKGDKLGVMTAQTQSGKALFEFRLAKNGRYIDPVSVLK